MCASRAHQHYSEPSSSRLAFRCLPLFAVQTYYEHAVVMALLPFMQPAYYGPEYYLGVPTAQLVP